MLVIIEGNFAGVYYISTIDAHIRTTFSHHEKGSISLDKGRFQFCDFATLYQIHVSYYCNKMLLIEKWRCTCASATISESRTRVSINSTAGRP